MPSRFLAEIRPVDLEDVTITMDVEVDEHGYSRCVSVHVDAPAVNGALLRRIPMERLLRDAVTSATKRLDREMTATDIEAFRQSYGTRKPPAGSSEEDEHLREVARVYREALSARRPPTEAVRRQWRVGRATAARWVGLSRQKGFLGKARPRRAGEEDA